MQTLPYKFQVVTPRHLPAGDYVVIGMTVQDYENLMKTQAEVLRWAQEAQFRCVQP